MRDPLSPAHNEEGQVRPYTGIYVHIPFCVRKCLYCDFLSFPCDSDTQDRYIKALISEIQALPGYCDGFDQRIDSIYIGGGTPSILDPEHIRTVMEGLREAFDILPDAEISMELNPGTVTADKLGIYRKTGVNRLSIGLQSVNDDELARLGRIHGYSDFVTAYDLARKAGFDNINVDIMRGIPGQTRDSFLRGLDRVMTLEPVPPEHISVYSLIIEEGTPFHGKYENGVGLPTEDEEAEMSACTLWMMRDNNYERYEISNYSKPGKECRHNLRYWERGDYIGVGIGASSLDMKGKRRYHNTGNIERYFMHSDRPDMIREDIEELSVHSRMEEFMFLGLRKTSGVLYDDFRREFDADIFDIYGRVIEKHIKNGLLVAEEDRLYLNEKGLDLSNVVMSDFLF